ncbi:MAG: DHH family phosphoesterase [Deltaproteobacteria bacterium]|nr:DHH family phosphoesterase [Deltaproteobacteria bacterium]
MRPSAPEKLRRFYDQFSNNDYVLILINADPDAIACAMAVKRLLWRKVAGITISKINVIKRPDNLAMIRLLGVNLVHVDEIDENEFTKTVIVDSQPDHNVSFARFRYDVIIDHHPDTGVDAPFLDIRPKYGAASSIMTEYLRSTKIKPSAKLATGLFLGIKTDTNNFERQTQIEDIKAFQFLFKYANIHLARKIEQAELRFAFLKYFKIALQTRRMRKCKAIVHLGTVDNPDVCVLIADFFMRVNSVTWSIISGIYEKKLIVIFRNDGIRKNAGTVAHEAFGFIGSAGGHKSMARAEMPVADLKEHTDYKDDKILLRWIISRIERKTGKENACK